MRRRARPAWAIIAATVGLGACEIMIPLPENAERMDPPAIYDVWWGEVESCVRKSANIDLVEWYFVPNAGFITTGGEPAIAYYDVGNHRIVIAGNYVMYGPAIRHEMVHALIPKKRGHPREYFRQRCGDVVDCGGECAATPPPAPPAGIVQYPADSLEVSVHSAPTVPSLSAANGQFVLVVTAHNPHPFDVYITLPPSGDAGRSVGFTFGLDYVGGAQWLNKRIYDDGARLFRAGETKRAVLDYTIGDRGGRVPLGPATADGGFGPRQLHRSYW